MLIGMFAGLMIACGLLQAHNTMRLARLQGVERKKWEELQDAFCEREASYIGLLAVIAHSPIPLASEWVVTEAKRLLPPGVMVQVQSSSYQEGGGELRH